MTIAGYGYLRAQMWSVRSDFRYECAVRDRNGFAIGKIIGVGEIGD